MKLIKKILIICILSIIALVCVLCLILKFVRFPGSASFLYNEQEHALIITGGDSSTLLSRIDVDMNGDTIVVHVQNKLAFMERGNVIDGADWKIHLKPNAGYVRFGNMLTPLSELKTYPTRRQPKPTVVEVFPRKYPYVCRW